MTRFQKYIRNTSIFLLLLFILFLAAFQLHLIPKTLFIVIILAKLLATLQFVGGMFLNEKGLKKGQAGFMVFVFGGMGARIFINLVVILFLSQILKVNFNSFILAFFIFYVIFLIIEMIYLAKYEDRLKLKK